MAEPIIQYAFSAGELSPTLKGRGDLEKYDLGLDTCLNFFVDYRGGVSTRPGMQFIDYVKADDKATKFVEFRFSPDIANTYLLLFGDLYLRFIQDGAYVLEADSTISAATKANPVVVTDTGHGYSNGDWIIVSGIVGMTELNGRTLIIANKNPNDYELTDAFGVDINSTDFTAYDSAGVSNRIYTVTTPYPAADLARLRTHQVRDQLSIAHNSHDQQILTRIAATNWTIVEDTPVSPLAAPLNVAITSTGTPSVAGVGYSITAIDSAGHESLASRTKLNELVVNLTADAGSIKVTWNAVTGAKSYNIYRTLFKPTGVDITLGDELGFIGKTLGRQFIDSNIIADFTKTPPLFLNPFADAGITALDVTSQGSGFSKSAAVTVTGTGSGFAGYPIVNDNGNVLAVVITNPGSGYIAPLTINVTTGSGETVVGTIGTATGNDPAVVTVFEQRKVYAGTVNFPMTLNGSKPDDFNNFDASTSPIASDAYSFTVDDQEVAPMRHLLPLQNGLLVASKSGAWLFHGVEGAAITALAAKADEITFNGFSNLVPLRVDSDVLYTQEGGAIVKGLVFNQFSRAQVPEDLSTLSNHLFVEHEIENWAYAEDPFKLIWAQRADGALLSFTYVRDQKVFAWARHSTKGQILDVKVIQEGADYIVYLMVKRFINSRWSKFIEKFASRIFVNVEEAWAVDAGLELPQPTPAAILTPAAATGATVNFTASAAVFAAGDVGKVIRAGGGLAVIEAFASTTLVTCRIDRDITAVVQEDSTNKPLDVASGDWTMTTPTTTVSGLHHLEGETVKVFADGNVVEDATVTAGAITLTKAASKIIIGLQFTAQGKTLPAISDARVIEGRLKRVIGIAIRTHDTRGLKVGADFDNLFEMKDRSTEQWGDSTDLRSDQETILIDGAFAVDGSIVFQQDFPLPATVLGFVLDADVGDDDDKES